MLVYLQTLIFSTISEFTSKILVPIQYIVVHIFNVTGGRLDASANGLIHDKYDDILQFDKEVHQWRKIGSMKMTRYQHAMSVVNFNEVADYCN